MLYYIIANIYLYTVILFTTIILNLYYFFYFLFKGVIFGFRKRMKGKVCDISNLEQAIRQLKVWIPEYYLDPIKGGFNWFCYPLFTVLRTYYLPGEKHSKDCTEHSKLLKWIIDNSKLRIIYYKTEVRQYLSVKPFVKMSHSIVLAYYMDSRGEKCIDVFTPYRYYKTYLAKDKGEIYKDIGKMLGYDNLEYLKCSIRSLF
jgi:hypothetical protein